MTAAARVIAFVLLMIAGTTTAQQDITFDGKAARVIENDKLAMTLLSNGGAMVKLVRKDDPENLNPLEGLGHFLCVDGFGSVSKEERAAGLPGHGEAYRATWELQSTNRADKVLAVVLGATLPIVQERFRRTIRMVDGENVLYIDTEVESLLGFDRPINWAEHATIGGAFLEQGKTVTELSATRSMTRPHESPLPAPPLRHQLADGRPFSWPMAPTAAGSTMDMRIAPTTTDIVDHTTSLMDPSRRLVFITAFHPEKRALLGYVFRREEYPWTQIWDSYPGGGKRSYRGLEFSTQPFDLPRREVIQTNTMFDSPTYRWLPAKSTITSSFLLFYAATPEGFMKVDDVTLGEGSLTIEDRTSRKRIVLPVSRGL
jgi:hypothetical protein